MASCNENRFCKCSEILSGEITDESFLVCSGQDENVVKVPASDVLEYLGSSINTVDSPPEGTYLISFDSDGNLGYIERTEYREFLLDEHEFLIGEIDTTEDTGIGEMTIPMDSIPPEGFIPTHALVSFYTIHDGGNRTGIGGFISRSIRGGSEGFTSIFDENSNILFQYVGVNIDSDGTSIINNAKVPINFNETTNRYEFTITLASNIATRPLRVSVMGFASMSNISSEGVLSAPPSPSNVDTTAIPMNITYLNHRNLDGAPDQTVVEWTTDPNLTSDTDIYNVNLDLGNGGVTTLTANNVTAIDCDIQRMNIIWDNGEEGLIIEALVDNGSDSGFIRSSNFGTSVNINSLCETTITVT